MADAPAFTIKKATLTLPDPLVMENVRVLIRNGYAIAYSRGHHPEQVWTAVTTGTRRVSHDTWELTLAEGDKVTVVKQDCNCR